MPLCLIDAASSCSRSGAIAPRGWYGFGSSSSTGTSPRSRGGSGSGRSAPSPLPSAFLFMGHQLLGEFEIGLGAPRAYVVEQYRLAEAGRLPEPDAARDHGPEHGVLEVTTDLVGDLLAQVGAVVDHRQQHALERERGVERALD